jgi:hypothetical protein
MRERRLHGFTRRTWNTDPTLTDKRIGKGRRWYDMAWSPADGVAQWTPHLILKEGEDVEKMQHDSPSEQVTLS